ncbi:MAG: hypothetical protein EVB11_12090 [Winogradskyella sp.]|nr:MAG: hypothetical protein EVB11_12090 [Winogradskyella sp.]
MVQQYQKPSANQEIVIQFTDSQFSEAETEASLASISDALQQIGAESISIISKENGFFHIAYHSDKAVSSVKQILSDKAEIAFDDSSESSEEDTQNFNLDIFQIENGNSAPWDFEGQQVYTLNLKSDRSFNPDVYRFPVLVESSKIHIDLKVAYNANQLVVFVSDNTSHNIPEVRAGPLA